MVNEGVESARGRTAVGTRVIVLGGMELANGQTNEAKDEIQTDTGSIAVRDTSESFLLKKARLNETRKDYSTGIDGRVQYASWIGAARALVLGLFGLVGGLNPSRITNSRWLLHVETCSTWPNDKNPDISFKGDEDYFPVALPQTKRLQVERASKPR